MICRCTSLLAVRVSTPLKSDCRCPNPAFPKRVPIAAAAIPDAAFQPQSQLVGCRQWVQHYQHHLTAHLPELAAVRQAGCLYHYMGTIK
jgi:hypothetical protein